MTSDRNQGQQDDPTRPPASGLPQGSDVGGIPSTLNEGVDRAGDRAAARRDGGPRSGTGEASASTEEMARGSAATAPRNPRDMTGSADSLEPDERVGPGGSRQDQAMHPPANDRGADDSLPESLGKSITEPFKSS